MVVVGGGSLRGERLAAPSDTSLIRQALSLDKRLHLDVHMCEWDEVEGSHEREGRWRVEWELEGSGAREDREVGLRQCWRHE